MGFLIAELALMLLLAAAAGAAFTYWLVRHRYRDASNDFFNLRKELEATQSALTKTQQAQLDQVQAAPSAQPTDVARSSHIAQLERKVAEVTDATNARTKAVEHQLRTLSRQLQDALPHPIDSEELARRLDTIGAAMPQARLSNVESRLTRLETMLANVCTQLGADVPAAIVPLASRFPSSSASSNSSRQTTHAIDDHHQSAKGTVAPQGQSSVPAPPDVSRSVSSSPHTASAPPAAKASGDADARSAPRPKTNGSKSQGGKSHGNRSKTSRS